MLFRSFWHLRFRYLHKYASTNNCQCAPVGELESGGEAEISSEVIGEIVMEHLRQLDDVAYVRFASVYRNFREAKDFETVLGELSGDDDARLATIRK